MFEWKNSKKIGMVTSLALSMFSILGVNAKENMNVSERESKNIYDSKTIKESKFEIDSNGTLNSYIGSEKEITIPEGVKSIACGAFMNKSEIEKVNFPEGLEKIDDYAFHSCESLKEVVLPNSLKKIGRLAFGNCKNCFKIYLGENTEELGEFIFLGCNSLSRIEVNEKNKNFNSYNGMLFNKECSILKICPSGYNENVILPSCTKSISCYAFLNCKKVKSVERISEEPIDVQDAAFYGCENLTNFNIGENIKSIGSCTFMQCNSLKEFTIPESVNYLGNSVFMCCFSLKKVKCLSRDLKIGHNLFASCPQTILIYAEKESPLASYALKHSDHLALV